MAGGGSAKPPEIVEVSLGQALRFGRHLDPALAERALTSGIDARRQMAAVVRASPIVRGLMIDGELVAIGGINGGLLGPAHVWLALGENAGHHRIALVRHARRELAKVLQRHGTVTALVLADDTRAKRFAEFLGFRLGPVMDAPNGQFHVATIDSDRS